MTMSCGTKITKDLSNMCIGERIGGFDLKNHFSSNYEIRNIVTNNCSILILHRNGVLLLYLDALLA